MIFEKRIEEVNWKTAQETNPDQYVKENGDTITAVSYTHLWESDGKKRRKISPGR